MPSTKVRRCGFADWMTFVGGTGPSGLAGRLLNDAKLQLISAEEPPTFTLAKRDRNWQRAILEEMKAIEENETW